jgi:hypothetical protein
LRRDWGEKERALACPPCVRAPADRWARFEPPSTVLARQAGRLAGETEPKRVESSDGQASVTFVVQVPRGKIEVADTNDPLAGS